MADDAPSWVCEGVSWRFPEARAWPLEREDAFAEVVYGPARSLTTITQYYGNAVGVAAVDGVIYAESDDFFAYAVNARTGKLIWRTSPIGNSLMGIPLVIGDTVYVTAGNVAFNFRNLERYAETGEAARGAYVFYNGLIALDRRDGRLLWYFPTLGETMVTPAYADGVLYFATGAGNVFAVDAESGEQIWRRHTGGMANMSSPAWYRGKIFLGMANPPYLYCLDAASGRVEWRGQIPDAVDTGMGDVTPAVDEGVVVMNSVTAPRKENGSVTMKVIARGFDAATGAVLWTRRLGRGPRPPSFKGGIPMIHDGRVYLGSPTTNTYEALDLQSGDSLWSWSIPNPGPAAAGRSPATWYEGVLYISTGPSLYALDARDGALLGKKKIGGRFGLVNPVIVGGTIYLGNSWDWLVAIPIAQVNPGYRCQEP